MKVVLLSYNHPELTRQSLESVLFYTSNCLLVHNGSLPQHETTLRKSFPQIEHFSLKTNQGFSGGANAGLKKAFESSTWAYFLTNDCQLLNLPKPPNDSKIIAPLIYFRNLNKVDSMGGYFVPKKALIGHCKSLSEFKRHGASTLPYVPGSSFLIHKDIFEKVGGFDESLHTYWEDVDFSVRIHKAQLPIECDPSFQVLHKVGKTCHKDSFYTSFLFHRNRKLISRRYVAPKHRLNLELKLNYLACAGILKRLRKLKFEDALKIYKAYY